MKTAWARGKGVSGNVLLLFPMMYTGVATASSMRPDEGFQSHGPSMNAGLTITASSPCPTCCSTTCSASATSQPVRPSATTSGIPACAVEIGARPVAIAEGVVAQEVNALDELDRSWSEIQEWLRELLRDDTDEMIAEELLVFPGLEELISLRAVREVEASGDAELGF